MKILLSILLHSVTIIGLKYKIGEFFVQNIGFDLSGIGANLLTRIWMLQRSFNWQLIMPQNINRIVGYLVSQYCQEIRFGDYSIGEVSALRYGPKQRFYAGLETIDTVTLTFLKPTDNSVLTYFYGWSELMIDKDGYYYPKNNYKKNIYVILYDRTGIQTTKFILKGVFPKRKPSYFLSYASEDIAKLEIELRVDSIEIKKGLLNKIVDAIL